jgi:predicted aconitase with swiveling domain
MRALVPGRAAGDVVFLDEGLSFWGGFSTETGRIIERTHPQFGQSLAGKIVVMPHARGSSSSSSVLAEALRVGTGPAALVLGEPDQIIVIGVLVAALLYGEVCPVLVAARSEVPGGRLELSGTETELGGT